MGEWLSDVFFGWIYDVFYTLQKSICYLLDFIRDIFCKLAGIETVNIGGSQEEILSHFILSPEIRNAFLGVLLVGVILLFVFVIIAIIKSEAADPQHKKTKGQILVKSLQSFVIFLLIPFLLIAGIMLANVVVGAMNQAFFTLSLGIGAMAIFGSYIGKGPAATTPISVLRQAARKSSGCLLRDSSTTTRCPSSRGTTTFPK